MLAKRMIGAALIAVAVTFGTIAAAKAQETKPIPMVVGVMDTQVILKQSKAGKSLDKFLKDKQTAIQNNIREQEKALQGKRQQLEQQRSTLSQQDFQTKENQLRTEMQTLRDDSEKKRKDFLSTRDRGFEQIIGQVDKVVQAIARERGLTLILNKSMIIMSAESWDITTDVLKRLDTALPAVKL